MLHGCHEPRADEEAAADTASVARRDLNPNDAGKISQRLEGFADEFAAILSRQVDERAS